MNDTPRTDARECEAIAGLGRCVGAGFARELERENAKLRTALAKCLSWAKLYKKTFAVGESGPLAQDIHRAQAALNPTGDQS